MADVSILSVRLYGIEIGTLTLVNADQTIFAFTDDYIAQEDRPTLGINFKDQFGQLRTEFNPSRTKLMPFFSNLLPEGHLRTYLAERAGVHPDREFFLIWVLGQDLPGAITVTPADGQEWPQAEAAAEFDDDAAGEREETALRFSLAGVHLKFSAVDKAKGGLTIPTRGIGGSWIVKLPSSSYDQVPENEFSMMTLAGLVGIDVPEIKLVELESVKNLPAGIGSTGGRAFAIKRFDRLPDGSPVHVEDFAQVFGVYPAEKYKKASYRSIARVLAAETNDGSVTEFIRRLTFNVLIGNADMHLKNWSLIYADRRHASLAPAYDFVSTIAYIPDENSGLSFSRTRRFDRFSDDELAHLAAKAKLPEKVVLDTAHETVERFHRAWKAEKDKLPMTQQMIEAIEGHVASIPIAR